MTLAFAPKCVLRHAYLWVLFVAAPLVSAPAVAQDAPQNFILHQAPRTLSELWFVDVEERPASLADFGGKVVLLNIWATWCAPCRREMPTLDRLQAELGGPDFEVVALSVDRAGHEVVRKFYANFGITNLAIYIDSTQRALRDLGVVGLPTTLLIDRAGRELGRLIGPAEWDSPSMLAFVRTQLEVTSGEYAPAATETLRIAGLGQDTHSRPRKHFAIAHTIEP